MILKDPKKNGFCLKCMERYAKRTFLFADGYVYDWKLVELCAGCNGSECDDIVECAKYNNLDSDPDGMSGK